MCSIYKIMVAILFIQSSVWCMEYSTEQLQSDTEFTPFGDPSWNTYRIMTEDETIIPVSGYIVSQMDGLHAPYPANNQMVTINKPTDVVKTLLHFCKWKVLKADAQIESKLDELMFDVDQLLGMQEAAQALDIKWLIPKIKRREENNFLGQLINSSELPKDIGNCIAKYATSDICMSQFKTKLANLACQTGFSMRADVAVTDRIIGENIIYQKKICYGGYGTFGLFLYNQRQKRHKPIPYIISTASNVFISSDQQKLAFIWPMRKGFTIVDLDLTQQIDFTCDQRQECKAIAWHNNNYELLAVVGNKLQSYLGKTLIFSLDLPFDTRYYKMAMSRKGSRLFLMGKIDVRTVTGYLIDLQSKQITKLIDLEDSNNAFVISDVVWTHDDAAIILIGEQDGIKPTTFFINSSTGKIIKSFQHQLMAVSDDGNYIAFKDSDDVKVMRIADGECICTVKIAHDKSIIGLSHDNSQLIIAQKVPLDEARVGYPKKKSYLQIDVYSITMLNNARHYLDNLSYPQTLLMMEIAKTILYDKFESISLTKKQKKFYDLFDSDPVGAAIKTAINQLANLKLDDE